MVRTGYRLEALVHQPEPAARDDLLLTNRWIDKRFVAAPADGAGAWRGPRHRRFIERPGGAVEWSKPVPTAMDAVSG